MIGTDTSERPRRPAPQTSIRRPLVILACWIVGLIALRFIVIEGTMFDQKFKPDWMRPKIDISTARGAVERADFTEAERILRELIHREPHYGAAHERLGYVLLQRDRLTDALREYEIAAEYQPDRGEIENAITLLKRRLAVGAPSRSGN